MAPKRNSRSSASSAGARNRSITSSMALMTPYPVTVTPPMDPPTIRANPVRHVTVQLDTEDLANTAILTITDVAKAIKKNTGQTIFKFVIEYVYVWGQGGPDVDIGVIDSQYGVYARDSGSYTQRARIGLRFSKNIQQIYANDSNNSFLTFDNALTGGTVHVGARYWGTGIPAMVKTE